MQKIKAYLDFLRPFTLLPPALGMVSGSFVAFSHISGPRLSYRVIVPMLLGALLASILNGASNGINQIYDLEIDRVNKPKRPLITGRISTAEAWVITLLCYAMALGLAWYLSIECFYIVAFTALCTVAYSAPPLRTKRHWAAAAITIAVPRGILLKVAGWSVLAKVNYLEPWYIGIIFGLFLLGATSTKDYADIEGDRSQGCSTLPIRFGIVRSIKIISPCFVLPFLLFPLGVYLKILHGNAPTLVILGFVLAIWGCYVIYLLHKDPESLAYTENHPSWTHMYLMMMSAQVVLALAYL